jgi:F-type H+-transporting ATPase subunit delta
MINVSRRQLARWAVEQLQGGKSPAEISQSLAALLLMTKRQKEAELLLSDIEFELENQGILTVAVVTSARDLSGSLRKTLISQIEKATKVKEVAIEEEVDKNVIGGIRIETPSHTWDNTIIRRLADIKGGI